jgi:hypothetical protein
LARSRGINAWLCLYSLRKAFAGFVFAARIAVQLTVSGVMISVPAPHSQLQDPGDVVVVRIEPVVGAFVEDPKPDPIAAF